MSANAPGTRQAGDCLNSLTLTVSEGFAGDFTLVLSTFPDPNVDGCHVYAMADFTPDSTGSPLVGTGMLDEAPGAGALTSWGSSGQAYIFSFLESGEGGTGSFQAGLGGPELARWIVHP
jgi:hypothetical protein